MADNPEPTVSDLEAQLHRLQRDTQLIFDAVPALIWIKDCHNRVLRANARAAAAVGMTPAELSGTPVREVHPDEADQYFRDDLEVIRTGRPKLGIVEPLQTTSGEKLWIRTDKVPFVDDEGDIRGVIVFAVDITEVKRAEEERLRLEECVQNAQRLESLGVLAGGIAHDFNNLLMGVLGNASLALLDLEPESPVRDRVMQIQVAAQRAADLTRQMLAYSGRGRFVVQVIDLNRLVEEMTHLLEVSTSRKAVLDFRFMPDLPSIEADATQVRQVIMNLLTNASDAIGDDTGCITIRTGVTAVDGEWTGRSEWGDALAEGLYVTCEVSDTGCGMDEATRARIFDPFFSTKFTGRGLGLAAVLGIMRGHRGAISVDSEPGRGTTFRLLFPASPQPADPSSAGGVEDAEWRGHGTALVVDDEEGCRAVTRAMLERAGFSVLSASNGREGLELLRANLDAVVVVLLDMMMPQMDGETAFHEIRRLRPGMPVILMSGYNEQDATSRFVDQGLAGFVQKPFRAHELWRLLREVLEA